MMFRFDSIRTLNKEEYPLPRTETQNLEVCNTDHVNGDLAFLTVKASTEGP